MKDASIHVTQQSGDNNVFFPKVWLRISRISVLCLLLLLALSAYILLSIIAPQPEHSILPFIPAWILSFIPYFAACAFVLRTKPLQGRWFWVELLLIFAGAVCFRVMLIPAPPGLSRDVWRYLWDGRVIVHGYSPYVYAPGDPILTSLRNIVFANARFRNIVTNYPPGAKLFFCAWLPTNAAKPVRNEDPVLSL